ncbi:MAG: methyl-accepting chemotaxis protein [Planctomycetia bacterium]
MRIADMSFRNRFALLALLFVLGYGALIVVMSFTLDRVMINGDIYQEVTQDKNLVRDTAPPPLVAREYVLLAHQLVLAKRGNRDLLLEHMGEVKLAYDKAREAWKRNLADEDATRDDLRKMLSDTGDLHSSASAIMETVETLKSLLDKDESLDVIFDVLRDIDEKFEMHRTATDLVVKKANEIVAMTEAKAADAASNGRFTAGAVAVTFIVLMAVVAWFVLGSILRSVERINARMREMAEADADLSARIGITTKDEIGQLAGWIDAFVAKIAGLVRAVKSSSIQLRSTATEMAATSQEQQATVSSLGASSSQIAAAVKEISATGTELTQTMAEVSTVARESSALANEGRASLTEMQGAMGQLASSSGSISSKLAAINEKARDITSVVTTITKVADQTNLLSVNAAIEAEKAGEYGRGFLVVAREIRRLADQTASATLDIEGTVQQMQGAVSAGVMEMDKFAAQVRRSVDEVDAISAKLQQIIERVELLTARFDTVTEGMNSQSQGVSQINDAMGGLNENVRITSQSLSEFNSAAQDMKSSVEGLKVELSRFRLED